MEEFFFLGGGRWITWNIVSDVCILTKGKKSINAEKKENVELTHTLDIHPDIAPSKPEKYNRHSQQIMNPATQLPVKELLKSKCLLQFINTSSNIWFKSFSTNSRHGGCDWLIQTTTLNVIDSFPTTNCLITT